MPVYLAKMLQYTSTKNKVHGESATCIPSW